MSPDTARPSSSLLGFFLPSARDLVFLLLFWALLAGPLSNRPLADADIGWHIRNGERILVTHSIPRTDPFSSTMHGQPWFAWEWLYDTALGAVNAATGLNGVVWMTALIIAATFAILFSELLRRRVALPLATLLALLALGASSIHLFARPHIASWLFTLTWFIALDRWEQRRAPGWVRWLFPASMLLWVNLHGGWLLGIAVLGVYATAALLDGWSLRDPIDRIRSAHRARAMFSALGLSLAATVANPYGLRLHAHICRYLTDRYLMSRIEEFRSPNFHGWGERCFAAILIVVLIAFAGRRASIRRSHLFVVVLAAFAGLYASRNLPVASMLLVLVAGPILWDSVASLAEQTSAWSLLRTLVARASEVAARAGAQESELRAHFWPAVAVIAALVVCLNGGRVNSRQVIDAHFDSRHLPAAAVDFLARQNIGSPVLSTDSWGGYLIYRLYPLRQVVIDDRHDLYGSQRFQDYLVLMQVEPAWNDVLKKWNIQTLLLPAGSSLASMLRLIPDQWQPVYEDHTAVVFESRKSSPEAPQP